MEALILRKTRSQVDILRTAIQYLTSNARSLLPALFAISFPLILAGNTISFLATDDRKSINRITYYWDRLPDKAMIALVAAIVLYYLGVLIFSLIVNKHLLSGANSENSEPFSFASLKRDLGEDLKNNVIPFIVVFAIYLIIVEIYAYFFGAGQFTANAYDNNPTAVLSYVLEIIVGYLPYLLIMSITLFFCICTLFVCYRDKADVSDAMKTVWHLITNRHWKAWLGSILILFIVFLCYTIFHTAFYMVEAGFWSMLDFSPKIFFISGLLQSVVDCFLVLYFLIAILFLFGSMEDEVEGYYIKTKIDNF